MANEQTFPKSQKLCSRSDIQYLLTNGQTLFVYPLLCKFVKVKKQDVDVQVAIVVSKRRFRHAVDRNRVKRLIRETYRKNKQALFDTLHKKEFSIHAIFIYADKQHLSYHIHDKRIKELINKLIIEIGA
ncbi:MAG: ribonuclease P protein component [Bacteroidales bacterium]|nr:ribonuclease P protein component [Bacteroidales bacterium]